MVKVQHNMSLHDETVQQLGDIKVPKYRRSKQPEREHPVDTETVKRTTTHERLRALLFRDVHEGVYQKALELADENWRRLEVVDNTTIVVHNNEVH
jgi:hypothetical protein